MDRPIIYTQENFRGFDFSAGFRDVFKGLGREAQDILGQVITVAAGLAASPASPASLSVTIGMGSILQQAVLDPTAAGDLPVDGNTYFLQAVAWASQSVTLSTAALASGQSQWALIEATFAFSDVIRSGDPNAGVLPFYNAANPLSPLQGQAGSGGTLPTERTATVSLKVVYGTPATTGSEVPPSADSGYVGLYLIDLVYGQTTITAGQILTAGPSVGTGVPSNYPYAPFLAGLLNQHHKGIPGQAPKIDLTAEVQNVLPNGNTTANTAAVANTIALRDSNAELTAASFNVSSDEFLKKNLRRIQNARERVRCLRGLIFERTATGRTEAGLSAQDMQNALPEAVGLSNGRLTINPTGAIALLVEAFLAMDEVLESLEHT